MRTSECWSGKNRYKMEKSFFSTTIAAKEYKDLKRRLQATITNYFGTVKSIP